MFVYKEEWNAKCDPNPEINYVVSVGAKWWIWINVFNKKFDNFFDIGWIEIFFTSSYLELLLISLFYLLVIICHINKFQICWVYWHSLIRSDAIALHHAILSPM